MNVCTATETLKLSDPDRKIGGLRGRRRPRAFPTKPKTKTKTKTKTRILALLDHHHLMVQDGVQLHFRPSVVCGDGDRRPVGD